MIKNYVDDIELNLSDRLVVNPKHLNKLIDLQNTIQNSYWQFHREHILFARFEDGMFMKGYDLCLQLWIDCIKLLDIEEMQEYKREIKHHLINKVFSYTIHKPAVKEGDDSPIKTLEIWSDVPTFQESEECRPIDLIRVEHLLNISDETIKMLISVLSGLYRGYNDYTLHVLIGSYLKCNGTTIPTYKNFNKDIYDMIHFNHYFRGENNG